MGNRIHGIRNIFSHELKECFNRETPRDIDENTAYFALDDVRMWIDVIAEEMKKDKGGGVMVNISIRRKKTTNRNGKEA